MKRESHILLGTYLLENMQASTAQRYEKAFLFGCIEPDINVFTYFKGSMRVKLLRGHNFKNSERCVSRTIEKIPAEGCRNMKDYYRLGKLIHYVSDAFTYPHNDFCEDGIRQHRRYEGELNCHFKSSLGSVQSEQFAGGGETVLDTIRLLHRRYSGEMRDVDTDTTFIISTAEFVFNGLISKNASGTKRRRRLRIKNLSNYINKL